MSNSLLLMPMMKWQKFLYREYHLKHFRKPSGKIIRKVTLNWWRNSLTSEKLSFRLSSWISCSMDLYWDRFNKWILIKQVEYL